MAVAAGFAMLAAGTASAQPTSGTTSEWSASNEASDARIRHGAWQRILDRYLHEHESGVRRFDYAALKARESDRRMLADYLADLQAVDVREYAASEQKAFWINLYNALTVEIVVEHYPVDSIRDISSGFLRSLFWLGPWKMVRATVSGRGLTLDAIEHAILRPIFRDDRIHYGLCCASIGCPSLVKTAFTAQNTDELLDAAARDFVNHERGVSFVDGDAIVVSSIYSWYAEDFGNSRKGVIDHLLRYADAELAARLRGFAGDIDYRYDWALNAP